MSDPETRSRGPALGQAGRLGSAGSTAPNETTTITVPRTDTTVTVTTKYPHGRLPSGQHGRMRLANAPNSYVARPLRRASRRLELSRPG